VFSVNKTAGTLTPIGAPIATGPAGSLPQGIVFNRRNNVFYTTNVNGGPMSVAAFRLDPTTGNVTPVGSAVPTNNAEVAVLLHPSGRFLYQYNRPAASIQRFTLDAATGIPTLAADTTPIPFATMVVIVIDISGRFLYVTSPATTAVSSYSINATTGALTLINSLPTSVGALATLPFQVQ
jgi:6-phosphogluconolactonase (cycloisomerase 2 family)